MTDTVAEFWWPHPDAFQDLTVEDAEHGYVLSAPDDTECAEWLSFWDQDEAHHKVFEDEFIRVLTDHANKTLEEHGENENLPERGQTDSEQAKDVGPGLLTQHEPGSDSESA
jgi:hypothetical protein